MNFKEVNKAWAQEMKQCNDLKHTFYGVACLILVVASIVCGVAVGHSTYFFFGWMTFFILIISGLYGIFALAVYLKKLAIEQ